MNKPKYVLVHTSAFRGDTTYDQIYHWHTDPFENKDGKFRYKGRLYNNVNLLPPEMRNRRGNGWLDFGYHILIRKDGSIEYGRLYNRTGAHCSDMGMNSKSLGVCFSGHGDFEPFTQDQINSFDEWYYHVAFDKFQIPHTNVIGHRETGAPKTCPGKLIDMDKFRQRINSMYFGGRVNR